MFDYICILVSSIQKYIETRIVEFEHTMCLEIENMFQMNVFKQCSMLSAAAAADDDADDADVAFWDIIAWIRKSYPGFYAIITKYTQTKTHV